MPILYTGDNMSVTGATIPFASMVKMMNSRYGSVTLPVRGVSGAFVLSRITGIPASSNEEGVSITRAVVLNSVLERLSKQQQQILHKQYEKVQEQTLSTRDFLKDLKSMAESTKSYGKGFSALTLSGLVVNKTVS